ncbi:MAG: stage III sporulation protein AE [Clostridia bacterium]|nr:stage III sporulation protein AE [Clostridia bacterium]
MKNKIMFIFLILLLMLARPSFASTEDTIEEQKNTFEIKQFIENADEYVDGEFLKESDLNDLLNSAIRGQVNNKKMLSKFYGLFGKEFKNTLATLSSILVIIVIHSILKSISESLENDNISRLIFYVQYILIVTIVMSNFSQIIAMIKTSTTNMVCFINILIPLLTTLMVFTGNLTTTSMLQPVIMFSVNFIGNLIHSVILPIVLVASSLSIISKISDRVQIDRLSKMFKSGITWFLGIALTIFVAVVSLEGSLSSSVDGITAKTTKAVVSSAIPIVGKVLGDAVDSVLGCGIILKNAVGIVGVVVILGICVGPILKLVLAMLTYKILARRLPTDCR